MAAKCIFNRKKFRKYPQPFEYSLASVKTFLNFQNGIKGGALTLYILSQIFKIMRFLNFTLQ